MKLRILHEKQVIIICFMMVALYLVAPSLTGKRNMVPWDNLYGLPPWQDPEQITTPHNMLISDMVLLSMPWQQFACNAYKNGEPSSWNPYIICGKPNYSGLLLGFRYPLNLVWRIISPARAAAWLFAFHIFTGILLTYLLAQRFGLCTIAAGLAGITYSLGGPVFVNMTFPAMWGGLAWLPGCLLAIKGLADTQPGRWLQRCGWFLFGLLAHSMVILSGHPELAFHAFFFSGCFTLYIATKALWQKQRASALTVVTAFILFSLSGLAIVQSDIPSFKTNFRADSTTYKLVRSYALPPYQTALFLAPNLYGSPVQHRYLDPYAMEIVKQEQYRGESEEAPPIDFGKKNYVEGSIYFGIIPLIMLLALRRNNKEKRFFWLYLCLALLIAFGTPLFAVFYYCVPFAKQLRTPFRWMIPAALCIGMLAGFGLDAWIKYAHIRKRIRFVGWVMLGLSIAAMVFVSIGKCRPQIITPLTNTLYHNIARCREVLASPTELLRFEMGQILLTAGWVGLAGLGCLFAARLKSARKGAILLTVIATINLITWAKPFYTHAPAELGKRIPDAVHYLQQQDGLFRIGCFGPDTRILPPNACMLYGLSDIRGYDSILPKPYVEFFNQIETQDISLLYNIVGVIQQTTTLDSPWLNFLNLQYVFTKDIITHTNWEYCLSDGINIYRNKAAYPRYYLTTKLTSTFQEGPPLPLQDADCEVIQYGLNKVVVSINTPEKAWLISSDADYGFWEAYIDGTATFSMSYLGIFRCVEVPQGNHTIEWRLKSKPSRDSMKMHWN